LARPVLDSADEEHKKVVAMTAHGDQPYVEPLSLTDVHTDIYETIATLEYTGKAATRSEIVAATDLDEQTIDASLADLTDRGMLNSSNEGDEPVFEPALRGWSAAPDQSQGLDQRRGHPVR
jgi:hypothetical protein